MTATRSVQVRDVPTDVVDELKSRAAARGASLSEFLRDELERIAARPSMDDLLARMAARPRRRLGIDLVEVLDEARADIGAV